MHPELISQACNLYHTSPELLKPLYGGHKNAVYQFPQGEEFVILRIGVEDCPVEQTLSRLDWVRYLCMNGAPVTAPVPSAHGQLLERLEFEGQYYNLTAFEKAAGILAEDIPPSEWTDELFRSIGNAVGRFHCISAGYQPSLPDFTLPDWSDSYEVLDATRLLASSTDPAREKLAHLIRQLQKLPTNRSDYGIIHDDLHFANFLIQEDGQVTVIDFDDCGYGWFAVDVAMALFDVLVLNNARDDAGSQRFAQRFMKYYLGGYRQERDLPALWLSQIPNFLKLKELCIYATLIGHSDVASPDSWVGRFMKGRAERIANDLPYVELDFSALVN